ncbi:MAG: biosynthetic peptidoglycan transglycosylase [Dialister sp.]|nr:biosynthetic peptidoglycan transglycosylase [Dialister sp.]
MKKLIFFILILAGSVYWGYNQGMSGQKPVRPHISAKEETKNPLTIGKDLAGEITDMAGAWISGPPVSKEENTEKEDSQKNSTDLSSAMERVRRVYHFKESLEAKVDRKQFVSSKDIPDMMKKAIVATEDRRFYDHGALDLVSVTRALVTNYMAGQTLEGGSTIAQQTVKNIFLSHDRTLSRKIEELALAVRLEKNYTKDEILELYLNTIYFGHGAYGIKDAARIYFGKDVKDLNVSQCAMLAGLPQAPSVYDPITHPEEGIRRMAVVLTLMAQQEYISSEDAVKAAEDFRMK